MPANVFYRLPKIEPFKSFSPHIEIMFRRMYLCIWEISCCRPEILSFKLGFDFLHKGHNRWLWVWICSYFMTNCSSEPINLHYASRGLVQHGHIRTAGETRKSPRLVYVSQGKVVFHGSNLRPKITISSKSKRQLWLNTSLRVCYILSSTCILHLAQNMGWLSRGRTKSGNFHVVGSS